MKKSFEAAHKARFGFIDEAKQIVVEAYRSSGRRRGEIPPSPSTGDMPIPARAGAQHPLLSGDASQTGRVYIPRPARAGHKCERNPPSVIEPSPDHRGRGTAGRRPSRQKSSRAGPGRGAQAPARDRHQCDPVMSRCSTNLFMSIAEQMGVVAAEHRYSVNIKERLDFFLRWSSPPTERWSPNAPTCRCISAPVPRGRDHHPREQGKGSRRRRLCHQRALSTAARIFPDITVCTPVFRTRPGARCCSGSRAAAITPISAASRPARCRPTPPPSHQEGIYIDNFKVVDRGVFAKRKLYDCSPCEYPARNPLQNVNDMKAQIAATKRGWQELRRWSAQSALPVVQAYMRRSRQCRRKRAPRDRRLHDSASATNGQGGWRP